MVPSTTVSGFSFAAASGRLHLFYADSSVPDFKYTTSSATPGSINFTSNYVGVSNGNFTFGGDAYSVDNSIMVVANGQVYVAIYDNTSATKKLYLYVRYDSLPFMGAPNFTQYTITDGSTHTGGFYPSIKVDATNAYISYLDGKVIRAVVIPLSTIGTPATWTYRTVYTDATYNIAYNALAIDASKAYLLWAKSDGIVYPNSRASSGLTLSSWPTTGSAGESSSGTQNVTLQKQGSVLYSTWVFYNSSYALRMGLSSDEGASWSNQTIDSSNGLAGQSSAVVVAGQVLFIAYGTGSGHPNNYSITLKKSLDGGSTW